MQKVEPSGLPPLHPQVHPLEQQDQSDHHQELEPYIGQHCVGLLRHSPLEKPRINRPPVEVLVVLGREVLCEAQVVFGVLVVVPPVLVESSRRVEAREVRGAFRSVVDPIVQIDVVHLAGDRVLKGLVGLGEVLESLVVFFCGIVECIWVHGLGFFEEGGLDFFVGGSRRDVEDLVEGLRVPALGREAEFGDVMEQSSR